MPSPQWSRVFCILLISPHVKQSCSPARQTNWKMWQAHNIHHDGGYTQTNKQKTRGLGIEWNTCWSETSACTSREGSSDFATARHRQKRQAIWWRRQTTEPSWHLSNCWPTIKFIPWFHPPFFLRGMSYRKFMTRHNCGNLLFKKTFAFTFYWT